MYDLVKQLHCTKSPPFLAFFKTLRITYNYNNTINYLLIKISYFFHSININLKQFIYIFSIITT